MIVCFEKDTEGELRENLRGILRKERDGYGSIQIEDVNIDALNGMD